MRDKLRTGFEKVDRVWAEVTNVLADTIPGIRVVKAFAQEKREAERFRESNARNLATNDRLNKTWVAVLADRHAAHRNWSAGRPGLRHLADIQGRHHGRRARPPSSPYQPLHTRRDSMSRIVSVTQKAAAVRSHPPTLRLPRFQRPRAGGPGGSRQSRGPSTGARPKFRYGTRAVTRDVDLVIEPRN